ncbi:MAG: hypothetical protein H6606_00475 [Flavobacteriales bacterium]|nr:hypothetical protein [Flavobacteriales bacterium]
MKGIYLALVLFLSLLLSQYVLFNQNTPTQNSAELTSETPVQETQKHVVKIYEDEEILVLRNGEEYVVIRKNLNT